MRSDAYILVQCDGPGCTDSIEIELTSIARGGYDMRNLDADLQRWGWTTKDGLDLCEECSEPEEEAEGE